MVMCRSFTSECALNEVPLECVSVGVWCVAMPGREKQHQVGKNEVEINRQKTTARTSRNTVALSSTHKTKICKKSLLLVTTVRTTQKKTQYSIFSMLIPIFGQSKFWTWLGRAAI